MSENIRNSPRTDSERDAHRATLERARAQLSKIDGVVSVGFAQKHTAGSYRDVLAIAVFVREKKPLETLAPGQRVPAEIEGIPTDVRVVQAGGKLVCNNSNAYDTIQGGIQIVPDIKAADSGYDKGTLGCIVRRRGDTGRENVYLLTCKHVLYASGAGANDYVHHPFAPPPPGQNPAGRGEPLGHIQELAFERNVLWSDSPQHNPWSYYLDCATARINIDSKCWRSTCTKDHIHYSPTIVDLDLGTDDPATPQHENQMIADVRNVDNDSSIIGKTVYKVGRTTGKTAGIVRSVSSSLYVASDPNDPNSPTVEAQLLIEIDFAATTATPTNCLNNERFAEKGDSGSIVVDENRNAIGLLAIGPTKASDQLPPPKKWPAWACHIVPVLDSLGICIPTSGGSSHGSCTATDGSGLGPAAPHAPVAGSPAGFDFSGASIASPLAAGEGGAERPAITDAERDRMLGFRDRLVATRTGRELHDSFVLVRRELGYLVRNSRPVKVVWHRNHGPAFFAHILNHLKGDSPAVPLEIDGVSRFDFLDRMGKVLAAHGSNPLRAAIARWRVELLSTLASATDGDDCLRAIAETDSALQRGNAQ